MPINKPEFGEIEIVEDMRIGMWEAVNGDRGICLQFAHGHDKSPSYNLPKELAEMLHQRLGEMLEELPTAKLRPRAQ